MKKNYFKFCGSCAKLSSIAVLVLFVSGTQFLFLGLVGEYVGRVLLLVNGKPQFVVRETINIDNERNQYTTVRSIYENKVFEEKSE